MESNRSKVLFKCLDILKSGLQLALESRLFVVCYWLLVGIIFLDVLDTFESSRNVLALLVGAICLLLIGMTRRSSLVGYTPWFLLASQGCYLGIGIGTSFFSEVVVSDNAWYLAKRVIVCIILSFTMVLGTPRILACMGLAKVLKRLYVFLLIGCTSVPLSDLLLKLSLIQHTKSAGLYSIHMGIFSNPSKVFVCAGITATIAFIFLSYSVSSKGKSSYYWYYGIFISFASTLIVASKTGFVILLLISLFFLVKCAPQYRRNLVQPLAASLLVLIALSLTPLAEPFRTGQHSRKSQQILLLLQGQGTQSSGILSNRDFLWRKGWNAFLQSPLVGHGISKYSSSPSLRDTTGGYIGPDGRVYNDNLGGVSLRKHFAGVHNMFLLLASEAGFIPAALFGAFFVSLACLCWKYPSSLMQDLTIGFSIVILARSISGDDLFVDFLVCTLLGMICAFARNQR